MKKQLLTLVVGLGGILSASAIDWKNADGSQGFVENYALGKEIITSSIREGSPDEITNGNPNTHGCSTRSIKAEYTYLEDGDEKTCKEEENWFLLDLGEQKKISVMELAWRDNHALNYQVYYSTEAPEYSEHIAQSITNGNMNEGQLVFHKLTTPLENFTLLCESGNSEQAEYSEELSDFEPVDVRYLLIYSKEPTGWGETYGLGLKEWKVGFIPDTDDILTTFFVTPYYIELNKSTELQFTFLNQFGIEIPEEEINITVKGANFNKESNTVFCEEWSPIVIKAEKDELELTTTLYPVSSPQLPDQKEIKTVIYSNGYTTYNENAQFFLAYNGGATDLGDFPFEDGNVARAFQDMKCSFFGNLSTIGSWDGEWKPIEKGWNEFHIAIFPTKDSNGYIAFEGLEGEIPGVTKGGVNPFNFSLTAGEWNDITIDVSQVEKWNNFSIRFNDENFCDLLLANIYFSGNNPTVLNIGSIDALEWSPEGMKVEQYVYSSDDLDIADCKVKVTVAPKGFDKIENFDIETSGLPSWQIAQWKYIKEAGGKVDGFLVTDPQGEIDSENNLIITTDCSGLYELTISSDDSDVSFQVDGGSIYKEYKQDLIIYPSLGLVYEYTGENGIEYNDGINLNDFQVREGSAEAEGGNYNNSEENLAKLSEAFLIIPGVYNAKIYYNVSHLVVNASLSRKKAPVAHAENGLPEGYENYKEATGMYGNVLDLSDIANAQSGTVNLVLAKNGVLTPLDSDDPTGQSSMTHFDVVPGTGGVVTSVGEIVTENVEAVTEYFTLDGIRVKADNLTKGIYIVKKGNKTSKIIL